MFGEPRLQPGQRRKWEAWELPWVLGFGCAAIILGVGLNLKPNTSIEDWAVQQAMAKRAAQLGQQK